MAEPTGLRRRTLLKTLAALPLTLGVPAALSSCSSPPLTERLDIASGEDGGLYFEFAGLLADALIRYGIARESTALTTQASVENLELLADARADLSLALADTVAQFRGETDEGQPLALGRVYLNYFHCIVPADSQVHSLADLAGRRLGSGAARSGTWVTGQRILEAAGLHRVPNPPVEQQLGLADGLEALASGEIDALFLFGGNPIGLISGLARRMKLRLVDLSVVLPTMRDSYPGLYERVTIPAGTYPGVAEAETLGVGNLVMARASLSDELAEAIVRLLVDHARELVPPNSEGIQYLTKETLISTAGQPLHPGAMRAYRALHG